MSETVTHHQGPLTNKQITQKVPKNILFSLGKKVHILKRDARFLRDIMRSGTLPYRAYILRNDDDILQARQLVAKTYMSKGDIDASYLDYEGLGTIRPEYSASSSKYVWFGVKDSSKPADQNNLLIVARLIHPQNEDPWTLQMHWEDIEADMRDRVFGLPRGSYCEFASFAKRRGAPQIVALVLMKKMMKYSLQHGIRYWVFGLNVGVTKNYEKRFGKTMQPLGKSIRMGKLALARYKPYLVDIYSAHEQLTNSDRSTWRDNLLTRAIIKFFNLPELLDKQ